MFRPVIYVPLADSAHLTALDCTVEKEGVLLITYDASLFNDDWSGTVECRFKTPLARQFIKRLAAAAG